MWSPTHVQVVVHRARNLTIKGKNGTNDAFVTIQLGKEKFQTSVKEKTDNPEWNEECELTIPDGNTSCVVLTALHRNFVGLDKFLGQTQIPLNDLFTSIYERSKNRWYPLEAKKGKTSDKKRGELEVRITFTVKSVTGSLMDLSKKPKKINSLPVKMVQSVGGSLMNLAGKDRKMPHFPFKTLANYGHKLSEKFPKRKSSKIKDEFRDTDSVPSSQDQGSTFDSDDEQYAFGLDPLPDEMPTDYEEESRVSKTNHLLEEDYCMKKEAPSAFMESPIRSELKSSSISEETKFVKPPADRERRRSIPILPQLVESPLENEESAKPKWNKRLRKMKISRSNPRRHTIQALDLKEDLSDSEVKSKVVSSLTPPPPTSMPTRPTPPPRSTSNNFATKTVESRQATSPFVKPDDLNSPLKKKGNEGKLCLESSKLLSNMPKEKLAMFEKMSKEDLVELIVCQQSSIDRHLKQIRDLEDYIDDLLVRVMETQPRLLQNPFKISPSIR
uniref:C2 domain-containing protein n=1 Tax=Strigamia maritima TaxID=126957 RepID=T1JBB1_STRMM